jgi:hypothetical protein
MGIGIIFAHRVGGTHYHKESTTSLLTYWTGRLSEKAECYFRLSAAG